MQALDDYNQALDSDQLATSAKTPAKALSYLITNSLSVKNPLDTKFPNLGDFTNISPGLP